MTTGTPLWFEHRGTRLHAVSHGEGDLVILLHGGLANHMACLPYAQALAARYRVVTPDLRGSGQSIDARPLTWDILADDIAALVRHLGSERAVIGGISFGSGVATRVALRHPDVTSALVVLHPVYAGADIGLTPMQTAAMEAMNAAGRRAPAEGVQVLMPLFDALPPDIRERVRKVAATYDAGSVAATTALLASRTQPFDTGADLAAISAPALLAPGIDPYHPAEVAEVYRQHLPRCTVTSGDPATFAGAITQFLGHPTPPAI